MYQGCFFEKSGKLLGKNDKTLVRKPCKVVRKSCNKNLANFLTFFCVTAKTLVGLGTLIFGKFFFTKVCT